MCLCVCVCPVVSGCDPLDCSLPTTLWGTAEPSPEPELPTQEGAVTPPRAVLGNMSARGQRAAAGLEQPFIQTTGLGAPQRRPPHTAAGIGPHRATLLAPRPGTGLQVDSYKANVHWPEVSGSWSCQKLPPPCTGQGCPPATWN